MNEETFIESMLLFLRGEIKPSESVEIFRRLNLELPESEHQISAKVQTLMEEFPFVYNDRWKSLNLIDAMNHNADHCNEDE